MSSAYLTSAKGELAYSSCWDTRASQCSCIQVSNPAGVLRSYIDVVFVNYGRNLITSTHIVAGLTHMYRIEDVIVKCFKSTIYIYMMEQSIMVQ